MRHQIAGIAGEHDIIDFPLTIFNARENKLKTESSISAEHITNNKAVRKTLLERGIRPETLPAAEDLNKVERRLASEVKKALKKPEALDS